MGNHEHSADSAGATDTIATRVEARDGLFVFFGCGRGQSGWTDHTVCFLRLCEIVCENDSAEKGSLAEQGKNRVTVVLA